MYFEAFLVKRWILLTLGPSWLLIFMYQPEGVNTDSIGHLAVQKTQFFICGRVSVHLWRSSAFNPDLSCTAEQTVKPLICPCIMKHPPLSGHLSRTNSGRGTCTAFWCIIVIILLLVFGHIHLRKCTVTGRKKGLQLFSVLVQLNLSLFFFLCTNGFCFFSLLQGFCCVNFFLLLSVCGEHVSEL